MRVKFWWGMGLAVLLAAIIPGSVSADEADVRQLLSTFQGAKSGVNPDIHLTDTGHVRWLFAPRGSAFATQGHVNKSAGPGTIAEQFMSAHAGAFTGKSTQSRYQTVRVNQADGRRYVRLQHLYAGLKIFGGEATVQLDARGDVTAVLNTTLHDVSALGTGTGLTPSLSASTARATAIANLEDRYPGDSFQAGSQPELLLYAPEVLGNSGAPQLVWRLTVYSPDTIELAFDVFIDAHTGATALSIPLTYDALQRRIYDGGNTRRPFTDLGLLVRSENQAPVSQPDANLAYDFLGDTYNFYFENHGRDSIDGRGGTLGATVRYCDLFSECPLFNAFYTGFNNHMYFGEGFVIDDIVAHELTHGVTNAESQLIYQNESGAINESLSDIWGEFIDLTNGAGNDTPEVRWLMGEDLPIGAIRDMADPPRFQAIPGLPMPDTYLGPGWYRGSLDNGGVHHNSGVGNKLCYLLTDGDTHNGINVEPLETGSNAIPTAASLFYEAQVNLLTASSGYLDFYAALRTAASNLGFSQSQIVSVINAGAATGILPPVEGLPLRGFRALSAEGSNDILLTWSNPTINEVDFTGVTIRRSEGTFPTSTTGTVVFTGNVEQFVDSNLSPGEYFYRIEANYVSGVSVAVQPRYARATTGGGLPNFLTEAFDATPDLSFTQIYIEPLGDPSEALNSDVPEAYTLYDAYTASLTPGVTSFPVGRSDAMYLRLDEESVTNHGAILSFTPWTLAGIDEPLPGTDRRVLFPFFGVHYPSLVVSANGYVAFDVTAVRDAEEDRIMLPLEYESPTLASHFSIRRIAPLFTDLSPATGGTVWVKNLADRFVVTFENVPEFGTRKGNSFQLELFYSGHIRITYGELNASEAVVGVSDGRGVPRQPDSPGAIVTEDLSALGAPSGLRIAPIPRFFIEEGEEVAFDIHVVGANGGEPQITVLPQPPRSLLTAVGPGHARFTWTTDFSDFEAELGQGTGTYNLQVRAEHNGQVAVQNVLVALFDVERVPRGTDLAITPEAPVSSDPLTAHFTYTHPDGVSEGPSRLFWYRNHAMVPALTGALEVPAEATRPGQVWHFAYTPISAFGTMGSTVLSPPVTIAATTETDLNVDGKFDAVDIQLVINKALGWDIGPIEADINGDGQVGADDIQLVINFVMGR